MTVFAESAVADTALADALRQRVCAVPEDWTMAVCAACTSTNSVLLAQIGRGSRLLFALEQTAGRGRRGREWAARPGDSLTFSLRHTFALRADALSGLSLAVGVVLADALLERGITDIALKWPNDLMRADRKLGGVLIELSSPPAGDATAVIGVGINLALPPAGDYAHAPAALCPDAPGREVWLDVGAALADALARMLPQFAAQGFAPFVDRWNRYNLHADRVVTVTGDGTQLCGRCLGADHDGALRLDCDGRVERVLAGDVSLRSAP
ncbi:biotin--[acetyl-CoA-carboxylase] ligase [Methyloversatilis sp.]|uniref:biotin--[acetyl-CoA-carboxylase] ligase n=1 Tax=Methyloversatilis sp. TaxID=2569862 RepID=UPI002733633E|nr:biotin--[acetyl-CoA-carboxylase] ligase [Methyloversatilis sp.]MDP2870538.1 biotin--[acetyl-CoA-carboxylase] ligase [Methyloversatilis sp.]MDP3455423.1 biotin--[acetyl-CoA-carboxylase] ligase [Methyloversatilis sp.]MDP3578080.1 biotin--[acetyl-CoA-carboxylase] ligase [Methyloversatilis sp.]